MSKSADFNTLLYVWLVATLKGRAASFQGAPPLNETLITLFLWSQLACMLKVILYYYKQGARFAPPPLPAPKSAILHLIPACTYIQKLFAVQVHLLRADLARERLM